MLAVCLLVLTSCGGPASSDGSSPGASADASGQPSSTAAPSSPPSTAPGGLQIDGLAQTTVDGLSLRTEPGTAAARIGLLGAGEPAFVVAGPKRANGYRWYQVAAVRQPYRGDCGDPAPAPYLTCGVWFGWVAAITPEGDQWLEPLSIDCPSARDTAGYLALLPASRLACAGNGEWSLTVYIAPEEGGRGCFPTWVITPGWLFADCNLTFPQPTESQTDDDDSIQAFFPPALGACPAGTDTSCPLDEHKGSWVTLTGHLDDPAARDCVAEANPNLPGDLPPAPDPDFVVFQCRTAFVVTAVQAAAAPG